MILNYLGNRKHVTFQLEFLDIHHKSLDTDILWLFIKINGVITSQ